MNDELLRTIAQIMDDLLTRVTGLREFQRKLVVYYTLATHALNWLDRFPLLLLKGPLGTGKSICLAVIAYFAHCPKQFSLRGRTLPTIRDELAKCHNGTAIVEESDQAWKDAAFECLLSDRYQRATAQAAFKESDRKGGYKTKELACFGATVLHRRLPFADRALDGRSILVRFKADHNRSYASLEECFPDLEAGAELVKDLELSLPDIDCFPGIAKRIFDTYKPLIAIAQLCEDSEFISQLKEHLLSETSKLKQAQALEPDGLVLRGYIECLTEKANRLDFSRNIRVGDIAKAIWENERVSITPQHVAALLRDSEFKTKESHGVTVVLPNPPVLVQACKDCGYEDEFIAALREELRSGREGRAGGPIPACGTLSYTNGREARVSGTQSKATGQRISNHPEDAESGYPHAGRSLPSLPALPVRESRPYRASRKKRINQHKAKRVRKRSDRGQSDRTIRSVAKTSPPSSKEHPEQCKHRHDS